MRKLLKSYVISGIIVYGILVMFFTYAFLNMFYSEKQELTQNIPKIKEVKINPNYSKCLNQLLNEEIFSELEEEKQELINYLNSYRVSFYYTSLIDDYNYTYNESKVYFGASLIKLLDALYIYDLASKDVIDLEETIKYESKYGWTGSEEMSKIPVGSMVSLRDLVKYAITVSDNTAHQMLLSYIGHNTLREYARSLGIKVMLNNSSDYGNISADDANTLLKMVYEFIKNNDILGNELKSYMMNTDGNVLQTGTDFKVAHKYGLAQNYFHDMGIIYHPFPYSLVVLTEHNDSKQSYETIISDIHSRIRKLHNKYIDIKRTYCLK